MEKSTRPYLLRNITSQGSDESEAPEFVVLDGDAQWNKNNISRAPGFRTHPFVRIRIEGDGTVGDVLELRGKYNDGTVLTLARATAGTGGVFEAVIDAGERTDCAYGVRVNLAGATALTDVQVYIESYSTEQARVLVS